MATARYDVALLQRVDLRLAVVGADMTAARKTSKSAESGPGWLDALVGDSPAMRRLLPLIEISASSNATVLIAGETGTGKELIAEAIHNGSARAASPFTIVDCSALSPNLAESELFGHDRGSFTGADATRIGAFETAARGTVFLDEIGELPLSLQPLLLRALENRTIRRVGSCQYRPIDVRVIAASHRDLAQMVRDGRFRADLYHRLNVVEIAVPPLRERAGDVELIATAFWRAFRPDAPLPAGMLQALAAQRWPGNVRELRNAVERIALFGWHGGASTVAEPRELASYQQAKEQAINEWERVWVEDLLAAHNGNLSRAARFARMGRSNLRAIAKRHGVRTALALVDDDRDPPT